MSRAHGRPLRLHPSFAVLAAVVVVLASCTHERIRSGGRTRHYLLHIPAAALTAQAPMPLVLAFHGAGGSAGGMRDHTGLVAEADRLGYLIAFLEGSGVLRSWSGADGADLQFVRDLIEHLTQEFPIDTSRVFGVGFSSGGRFVQQLACDPGVDLAAFASVSSTLDAPTASECGGGRGVSAIFVLGADDPSLETPRTLSVTETGDFWAELNGCSVAPGNRRLPDSTHMGPDIESWEYDGCTPGHAVTLYVLDGQGHEWPRGSFAASRIVGEFLSSIQ